MRLDRGARLRHGDLHIGVREVVHRFRHRFGGRCRQFAVKASVQGFFGVQSGAVQTVGTAPVADSHGLGHLRGLGLREDVERGHPESDDLGGLQHLRAGAGGVGGEGIDDFASGPAQVGGVDTEVGQQEGDNAFQEEIWLEGHWGDRCGVWLMCGCAFVLVQVAPLCQEHTANKTPHLSERLRREIETDGDKLTDLDVRRLGPGDLAAVMSVRT